MSKVKFIKKIILSMLFVCPFPVLANHVLYNTGQIGTPDQPTIEGGILNTEIKMSLESKQTHQQGHLKKEEGRPKKVILKYESLPKVTLQEKSIEPNFSENFSSDKRVTRLLNQAAKDGKLIYVLKKAQEKGLPASVAIIPMVESAYKEKAVSKKGAAGVWQLMPSVAKDYGINNQSRHDFKISTEVALQYLADLNKRWGNWQLTLAAYNAGSHRVLKAIRRRPHAKSIYELELPRETQNYLKEIEQTHRAIGELALYGT